MPVYTVYKYQINKTITSKIKRIVLLWVLSILTTPVFFLAVISFIIMICISHPRHAFTKKKWATEKEERYQLVDDMITSQLLIGKSKQEVIQLLELEHNSVESECWHYNIGRKPGVFNLAYELEIDFLRDRAQTVSNHPIPD